jgi:DNA-binding winged helix-turn-helix (wHTH) protein/Tol biopolymer transport system component
MSSVPPITPTQFGVFELDLERGELRRRGVRLAIQVQPLRVLAALLREPGEIISRNALEAVLWGPEPAIDSERALNKAIHKLREVLGDDAEGARFVETVPRRGYRFVAPVGQARAREISEQRECNPTCGELWLRKQPLLRASILPPTGAAIIPYHLALSPDGARLLFLADGSDGMPRLWMRALARAEAVPVRGTERARLPFWSPDGRAFGFFADGKLKSADVDTGDVRSVCDARIGMGGAWSADDVILFAPNVAGPLFRVPAHGGTPVPVTCVDVEQSSQSHYLPVFAEDGRHFLFSITRSGGQDTLQDGLFSGSLDTRDVNCVSGDIRGNVALAGDVLLFVQGTSLLARQLDQQSMQLRGETVVVASDLLESADHSFLLHGFSASHTGLIVFQSSIDFAWQATWVDATGQSAEVLPGRCFRDPAISPDGTRLAFASDEFNNGTQYICVQDLARGVRRRVTDGGAESHPSWSADGERLAYVSRAGSTWNAWEIAADGSTSPQVICESCLFPTWSVHGHLVVMQFHGRPVLAVRGPGEREFRVIGSGAEPQVSPDGIWIAAGQPDGAGIMVRALASDGPVIQISTAGGCQPRWSRDGRQLFFIARDRQLMAVDFCSREAKATAPRSLFRTRIPGQSLVGFQYDVAPDGRFVINNLPATSTPLTLLYANTHA